METKKYTAVIVREDPWYVAHCVELGVVSQGRSIEVAQGNLKEAVELYLESVDRENLPNSTAEALFYTIEVA